ncbi:MULTISPECIES: TetR/AcrR family transcriptional regulator [unclassified Pseudodesulfovibrio]|uniref:TetR/AcrR family transcriptional regulator n=1 Tax=unclassified Pseudodesulfovibrio TaxID=2661612 RepID=UPI000FEB8666|nr:MULTISPECIES: TetR/AcrR family transcriptional regulator [unclassified Pseudodesulfovibrio]MCJ2165182.1 TetR/AcrR family transcriptional regulator [Pseudodesulfovibrio sp. S3-i]RWU03368.1 TetR/AcrR family transcriptional regulator [Pseudodesulfovibrio sp. S3]
MSTQNRRERDKEKMRRSILDAAKRLFVKEGFDNVTLRRVASKIEYSPAAIYRYFKNKREILSVLREEGFARYVERQRVGIETISDPMERLREGGRQYVRFALREPEYYYLMFSTSCEQVDLDGEWAASSMISFKNFRATVQECVKTGYFGEMDVDTLVFGHWSSVHGLAHLIGTGQVSALMGGSLDVDALTENLLEFWMRPFDKGLTPKR